MNIKHLLIATVLFLFLSPGAVLTLPPGKKGFLNSLETGKLAIFFHTFVFLGAFAGLMYLFNGNSESEQVENTKGSENTENTENTENN